MEPIIIILSIIVLLLLSSSSVGAYFYSTDTTTTPARTTTFAPMTTTPAPTTTFAPVTTTTAAPTTTTFAPVTTTTAAPTTTTFAPVTTTPAPTTTFAPAEVYGIVGYNYTQDQAENACSSFGGTLATKTQLQQAQTAGADWCSSGWVKGENEAMYPSTTRLMSGCGNGSPGIKTWTPPNRKAAVNCFGVKPQRSGNIHPFNESKWSLTI